MPSIFDTLTWLEKTNNPFGVRCLDCRLFAQSMRSTVPNLNTVAQFNGLRSSTGEQHTDQLPPNVVTVSCNLTYPYDGQSEEGPLFVAEVMEDKWDSYFYDNSLYFARSWTGSLVFRAKMRLTATEVTITTIDADAQISSPDMTHIVRQVDFLLKSHLYGWDIPHPLPVDLPPEVKPIALYSFGQYGRRALFATYEDTLPIRLT